MTAKKTKTKRKTRTGPSPWCAVTASEVSGLEPMALALLLHMRLRRRKDKHVISLSMREMRTLLGGCRQAIVERCLASLVAGGHIAPMTSPATPGPKVTGSYRVVSDGFGEPQTVPAAGTGGVPAAGTVLTQSVPAAGTQDPPIYIGDGALATLASDPLESLATLVTPQTNGERGSAAVLRPRPKAGDQTGPSGPGLATLDRATGGGDTLSFLLGTLSNVKTKTKTEQPPLPSTSKALWRTTKELGLTWVGIQKGDVWVGASKISYSHEQGMATCWLVRVNTPKHGDQIKIGDYPWMSSKDLDRVYTQRMTTSRQESVGRLSGLRPHEVTPTILVSLSRLGRGKVKSAPGYLARTLPDWDSPKKLDIAVKPQTLTALVQEHSRSMVQTILGALAHPQISLVDLEPQDIWTHVLKASKSPVSLSAAAPGSGSAPTVEKPTNGPGDSESNIDIDELSEEDMEALLAHYSPSGEGEENEDEDEDEEIGEPGPNWEMIQYNSQELSLDTW